MVIFSDAGNFSKVNNLCVLRLKQIQTRLCSNNDNGKIPKEIDNESSDNYEQDIKSSILQSSLPYVPQHGWSRDAITAGINC